jgi:Uma2 family endonuclease
MWFRKCAYGQAMRIRYPDICLCPAPIPQRTRTLTEAVAVFEVLSDDTARIDRVAKLEEYAEIPGIRCYILVEQDRIGLTLHQRRDGRWESTIAASGTVSLADLNVDLPLAGIYAGLRLPDSGT